MKTQNLQNKLDLIIEKVFLRHIPKTLKPNYITYFRVICVPVIYILLEQEKYLLTFPIFIIAASSDFIDGALARTRNQKTDLGKIIDPIADKMLILTILLFIGLEYLVVKIFVIFILFEVVANLSSALFAKYLGKPIGANIFGKIKMILQSFSVGFFLLGILIHSDIIINTSIYILAVALFFAFLSAIEQTRLKFKQKFLINRQ